MQKRRQFRLRHRTQRSLGKKEKITTQKIGKYTARYCDILNRNNRKRQKKERYRAIKAESPAVYTKNTPTSDGSIGQRSGKTHKSGIRLATYTQKNQTHCTQKKTSAVTEKSQPIIENHLNAKMRNADKQSKNKARQSISKGKFSKRSKAQKHCRTRSRRKKSPSTRSKYAMPSFLTTITYKCFTKCVKHWQKIFRFLLFQPFSVYTKIAVRY